MLSSQVTVYITKGWIADIYEFMHETFVEVKFDSPAADGRCGCILNNLGMIRENI